MTRINVGVHPSELTRQHLLAEHREIKRIPNAIRNGRCNLNGIPDKFCLGKGHVKFFYNKLGYLLKRYRLIYEECLSKKYNITNYESCWDGIPIELMGDYVETAKDRELILNRIRERLYENY